MTETLGCGHYPTKTDTTFTNGIARDPSGKTMCYDCAADRDRTAIAQGETLVAYVSTDGKSITTWAGIILMRVTKHWTGRGFYRHDTHYFNAVSPAGTEYYGKNGGYMGGNGCAVRLKARKQHND